MEHMQFRGKRIDNNQWEYGFVFHVFDEKGYNHGFKKHVFITSGVVRDNGELRKYEVEADSVGQNTLIKDMAKRDIYQGDIVKIEGVKEESFVVVYCEPLGSFKLMKESDFVEKVRYQEPDNESGRIKRFFTDAISGARKFRPTENYLVIGDVTNNFYLLKGGWC